MTRNRADREYLNGNIVNVLIAMMAVLFSMIGKLNAFSGFFSIFRCLINSRPMSFRNREYLLISVLKNEYVYYTLYRFPYLEKNNPVTRKHLCFLLRFFRGFFSRVVITGWFDKPIEESKIKIFPCILKNYSSQIRLNGCFAKCPFLFAVWFETLL